MRADHTPQWLEELDHTADEGMVVRADDLPQLFERAAFGMFRVLVDLEAVRPNRCVPVTVQAPDRQALMVRWLSELHFLHETERLVFAEWHVRTITTEALTAEAWGEKIDPARHTVYTEIKAVTFHGLSVKDLGGSWEARVIFDL